MRNTELHLGVHAELSGVGSVDFNDLGTEFKLTLAVEESEGNFLKFNQAFAGRLPCHLVLDTRQRKEKTKQSFAGVALVSEMLKSHIAGVWVVVLDIKEWQQIICH